MSKKVDNPKKKAVANSSEGADRDDVLGKIERGVFNYCEWTREELETLNVGELRVVFEMYEDALPEHSLEGCSSKRSIISRMLAITAEETMAMSSKSSQPSLSSTLPSSSSKNRTTPTKKKASDEDEVETTGRDFLLLGQYPPLKWTRKKLETLSLADLKKLCGLYKDAIPSLSALVDGKNSDIRKLIMQMVVVTREERRILDVSATRRLAFVCANTYRNDADPLPSCAQDATDMTERLQDLGFTVTEINDQDLGNMQQEMSQFAATLESADDVLLYFSGHGFEQGNDHYFLPEGYDGNTLTNLEWTAVSLNRWINMLTRKSHRVMVLADCCRVSAEQPTKNSRRAALNPLSELRCFFSSAPGAVSFGSDAGRRSYFTDAVLDYLKKGVEYDNFKRRVSKRVREVTHELEGGSLQLPFSTETAFTEYHF